MHPLYVKSDPDDRYDFIWVAEISEEFDAGEENLRYIQLLNQCDISERPNPSSTYLKKMISESNLPFKILTVLDSNSIEFPASSNSFVEFLIPETDTDLPFPDDPRDISPSFKDIDITSYNKEIIVLDHATFLRESRMPGSAV